MSDVSFVAALRRYWPALSIATVLGLGSSGFALVQPIVGGRIVSAVTDRQSITLLVVALAAAFVLQVVTQAASKLLLERSAEGFVRDARSAMGRSMLHADERWLSRARVGDLVSRGTSDTAALGVALTDGPINLIIGLITVVVYFCYMAVVNTVLAAVVIVAAVLSFVLLTRVTNTLQKAIMEKQQAIGAFGSEVERVVVAAHVVKTNQTEHVESARLQRSAAQAYNHGVRAARLTAAATPLVHVISSGAFLVVIVIASVSTANGSLPLGDLVTLVLLSTYLTAPIGNLFQGVIGLQSYQGARARIQEVLDATQEASPKPMNAVIPASTEPGYDAVEFENVTFTYDQAAQPTLRGVSLAIRAHTHTGIVGSSGSGKTTIMRLICGLQIADDGEVRVHGVAVSRETLHVVRSWLSVVDQNATLMDGTLRDNVTYGAHIADDAQILTAMREAGLSSLLNELPRGLDTTMGEHGDNLSGGQRQRIALARALVRKPRIILLDEPTSMLDTQSEQLLVDVLDNLKSQYTIMTVSHRESTLVRCDDIYEVSESGVIAPSGGRIKSGG